VEPKLSELVDEARRARDRSHVPYSDFRMGAAVLTSTGDLVPGAVVENVSLGLAMCAERVAMFSAVARGDGRIEAIALVSERTDGTVTLPCGACLQVARELGDPDLVVVAADLGGQIERRTLRDLAPELPAKS